MSFNYRYNVFKFNSLTDDPSSFRFVLCPGNHPEQVMAISDAFLSYEGTVDGIRYYQSFVNDEIIAEAEALDLKYKTMVESEHFRIWEARRNEFDIPCFMFEIRNNGRALLTSAHDYENKQNCIDGLMAVLENSHAEIEPLGDPKILRFDSNYFKIKK